MNLPTTLTRHRHRTARRSPEPRPRPSASGSAPKPRARRAGLPIQDRALYSCECGFAWHGEVTASVGCPHCGTPQAW